MGERPATVSIQRAAEMIGIGRSLVYELARRGELLPGVPVYRVGRRYVVPLAPLRRALGASDEGAP